MWPSNWVNMQYYKGNNSNNDDNNNLKQNIQTPCVKGPCWGQFMEVNAVEPQGRKVSGLIGDYKKVKEQKRLHALSHTAIEWFESSDRPN